jgi:hypothetical protein
LHPTKQCETSRYSFWWDRHSPVDHVAGTLWLNIPEKWRWIVVGWFYDRHPDRCWCDLVDAALLDLKKDDYRKPNGCGCDVPLPTDAGEPRPGWCYCEPKGEAR